jgi:competence protein ComFC
VRLALYRLKFGGLRSVAEAMAPSMVEALARSPPSGPPLDEIVITWVPLGRRRRRSRGYDQSEALAIAVAALTGWRVASLAEREIETGPQAKRPGPERREAVAGAFRARPRPPERVVLVDDVMTTGGHRGRLRPSPGRGGRRPGGRPHGRQVHGKPDPGPLL